MNQRVVIVGAGIGGLTLAQGLRRAGIAAAVYERDAAPEFRAQGYRVTLRPTGLEWLERCLTREQFDTLLGSSQVWSGMNIMNEQLTVLAALSNPKEPLRSIDRLTLRRILLRGIEDQVHFAKPFERFAEHADHVTAHFSDGSSVDADLLVGADGHQSRVRSALLPQHAQLVDTGQRDLAGKLPLTPETRQLMRDLNVASISIVTTVEGLTMVLIPQESAAADGAQHEDYMYWGLVAPRERYAAEGQPEPADPAVLKQLAFDLTRSWHPLFRRLIELTPPNALNLLVFRSSVPHGPWSTGRVTLLGDAVHSMVPMRGEGANTAIRDAGMLTECVARIAQGTAFRDALSQYEREMLAHGFGKVRESLSSLELFVSGSRLRRKAIHTGLGLVQRARRLFRPQAA